MNFLLQMIGRSQGLAATFRPGGRRLLMNRAAAFAVTGRISEALAVYQRIAAAPEALPADIFICGHLQLMLNHGKQAAADFADGINQCLVPENGRDPIDDAIAKAAQALSIGRYRYAIDLLEPARVVVDAVLSATAGLHLASGSAESRGSLLTLAKLGDLLLLMLARTHLASNVAQSLRLRELREDLAPYAATTQSALALLAGEMEHLQQLTSRQPDHAESQYRLGLVARALGQLKVAGGAFVQVLRLHPHHTSAAALLAATQIELEPDAFVLPRIAAAFAVSTQDLQRYHEVACAAGDAASFNHAVEKLCQSAERQSPGVIKANLAFVLAQLSLLDRAHAEWREVAPIGY